MHGAAGKDVVKRVARGEGRSGAADYLTPRHNRDVGSSKLLQVHIPITCRNPVWEALQEREQCSHNGDIGLCLQPCSGLQVNGDQSEPPLHSGQLDCDKAEPSTVKDWISLGCACQGVATTSPPLVELVAVAPAQKEWRPTSTNVALALASWAWLRCVSCARRQSAPVC